MTYSVHTGLSARNLGVLFDECLTMEKTGTLTEEIVLLQLLLLLFKNSKSDS